MLYLMAAAYSTILFAEMLGDKSIYVISSLAARFRTLHVLCGVTLAFLAKMLVAVLVGHALFAALPANLITRLSAATFFVTAIFLWLKRAKKSSPETERASYWSRSILVSFAAVFFSEWGDVGQLFAANLTARYQAPLIILIGGTAALTTKAILAASLGRSLRKRIGTETLRYGACCLCVLMGIFSLFAG